jgi:hypothetical protein
MPQTTSVSVRVGKGYIPTEHPILLNAKLEAVVSCRISRTASPPSSSIARVKQLVCKEHPLHARSIVPHPSPNALSQAKAVGKQAQPQGNPTSRS